MNVRNEDSRVIILDDVLSIEEYKKIEEEVLELIPQCVRQKSTPGHDRWRTILNETNNPNIIKIFANVLHHRTFFDRTDKIMDTAFQMYRLEHKFSTALTIMDDSYGWHGDIFCSDRPTRWSGQMLVWVWYYNPKKKFSGGELILGDKGIFKEGEEPQEQYIIKPADNRFVMFPSYISHKVIPINPKGETLFDKRITIHGGILFLDDPNQNKDY